MEILSLIKEKLTDAVIDKISGFLGEHPDKISTALNSAVPTVLGGIMQKANTPEETGKIMDVLKEGGHTGDILDDLSGLLGHFDKTQMLITIGSNIANHFFGEKSNNFVDTLSAVSGIRKTSSSSLLGLATPLVLGAIGKVVDKEGLGISGLTNLLSDQKASVQKALPPALYNLLDIKNTASAPATEQKIEKPAKKSDFSMWIPWILLLLLALGALAWVKGFKGYFSKSKKSTDSVAVVSSPVIRNDSAFAPITKIDIPRPTDEKVAKSAEKTLPETPKSIETPKTEIPKIDVPATSGNSNFDGNADAWKSLEKVSFKKSSAEITASSELNELVSYLKSHAKAKVKIGGFKDGDKRLSEDRAYAVREILLEKGVRESQILINSEPIGESSSAKIGVKVSQ
jgi:OmpA-OmpF porin, OOP family